MKRPTVYLDTTIPSYLFDDSEELKTLVQITQQWWEEERQQFEVYVSEETIVELNQGDYPNKLAVLESISGLPILWLNQPINDLAKTYMDNYLMPRKHRGDASQRRVRPTHISQTRVKFLSQVEWTTQFIVVHPTRFKL